MSVVLSQTIKIPAGIVSYSCTRVFESWLYLVLELAIHSKKHLISLSKSQNFLLGLFFARDNEKKALTSRLCYTSSYCAGHLIPITSSIASSQTTSVLFHRNTIQNFIDCSLWGVIPQMSRVARHYLSV